MLSFNQRTLNWLTEKILKFPDVIDMFQDALILAHRALAAFRALRRRCSGVMLAARALPPILPPSRPSSDSIWDRRERGGCSGSLGRSPNNLCTAIKPAWTSSSGALPIRWGAAGSGREDNAAEVDGLDLSWALERVQRTGI